MNDLPRLKLASNQVVCRLLLESALEDHSAPGAAERALCALNLGAGAAATAAAAQVSASSGVGSHFVSGVVLKWLGLGLLAGAVTVVSAEQAVRIVSPARKAPPISTLQGERASARQAVHEIVTAAPAASELAALPSALPASHTSARAPEPLPASAQSNEPVPEPLQDLRTIRRALSEHAPARALTLLDVFVTRYPSSTLLEESAVLRFDALLALGSSQARSEGEAFLRRYPRSAYAQRVNSKLSGLP